MIWIRTLFGGWKLLITLLVVAGVAVNVGLGLWQLDRHRQRVDLNQRIESRMAQPPLALDGSPVNADELDYRRVVVRGRFDPDQEIVLRNRSYGGITGVHVLTPLRISGSTAAVLVDRGWIPMIESSPADRQAYQARSGEVTIDGVALRSQEVVRGPVDVPLAPGETRIDAWFRVDVPRIQQQVGYPLLPVFIEQQPGPGAPQLPARTATTDLGLGSHFGYAIQWFSFGMILLVTYLALTYQQIRRSVTSG
jgi:surfeit locus 1 family protein